MIFWHDANAQETANIRDIDGHMGATSFKPSEKSYYTAKLAVVLEKKGRFCFLILCIFRSGYRLHKLEIVPGITMVIIVLSLRPPTRSIVTMTRRQSGKHGVIIE